MQDLLFLCHRIPYPPDKGDKIRSWNILRHLAQRYRVHLGCFVDDPRDWQYVETVRALCGETYFARLTPPLAKLRSLTGLAWGAPLTLGYFHDFGLKSWVRDIGRRLKPETVLVFSSGVAAYALLPEVAGARRVVDLVDVDSDKWRQCAERARGPMRWVYGREARTLLDFERLLAEAFDASLLVSPHEADLFRALVPEWGEKVDYVTNGVDAAFFTPDWPSTSPYRPGTQPLVFTGAMDYWPNVDAVGWFAREVLPELRAVWPMAEFAIVGSNPTPEVRALAALPGVTVTGRVPDVRPWLAHAAAVVAPLRIARGVQNKVLEAMAMGRPVVASSPAVQGIDPAARRALRVADTPQAMAAALSGLLAGEDPGLGRRARDFVLDTYVWPRCLERLDAVLEGRPAGALFPPQAAQ